MSERWNAKRFFLKVRAISLIKFDVEQTSFANRAWNWNVKIRGVVTGLISLQYPDWRNVTLCDFNSFSTFYPLYATNFVSTMVESI